MPKRTDLKKIMIIGSGPIVIGQAAEFDYAGTQACLSLKEEGYEVILVNSNPATIMTPWRLPPAAMTASCASHARSPISTGRRPSDLRTWRRPSSTARMISPSPSREPGGRA